MPQLSIRTRLNVLIGTLLVMALAANIVVILWSAGPRIRAEHDSIARLTIETVDLALGDLESSTDPARDLVHLLDRLARIRHAHVYLEQPTDRPGVQGMRRTWEVNGAPLWFAKLLQTERAPVRIPIELKGQNLGTIVIASKPSDEIAEIWDATAFTLTAGLALITAVFALTTFAVRQALMPIQRLENALRLMQGGEYAVALPQTGPPELAEISARLNELAAALQRSRDDNSRLTEQIISLEDHERRELARELHDEFGPYLFAVRANLSSIQAEAERDTSPAATARAKKCTAALDQISALQQLNRHVLQRLRPPSLNQLGLNGALRGMVANWRENNSGVIIDLSDDSGALSLDATSELTVYRVVQEGLTNAFRHANATAIRVEIKRPLANRLTIRVADDGEGDAETAKPGFGLSGMSDRVRALGGTIALSNPPEGGFALDVSLPVAAGIPSQDEPATRGFVALTASSAHVSANAVAPDRT